ncbi:hypothetical protein JZU57_01640, partial [bacterium]|nr:hypothetical protein [bacterium]
MKLNITKQATVNAGIDETVCQNNSILLKNATPGHYATLLWTHNGAGSLADATLTMPTYTPGAAESGAVTLTLTALANS